MHWTKAENLMKRIGVVPSFVTSHQVDTAEKIVTNQISALIKTYHPDTHYVTGQDKFLDDKFLDIRDVQETIKKYSFKEIFDALKTAPGIRSDVRTKLLEAKVKRLQEGVKINVSNLVEGFNSGQYFYGLADNAAGNLLLLANPNRYYGAESIDLDAALSDSKAFPYFKNILESKAKGEIPTLENRIKDYHSQLGQYESRRIEKLNSLNLLKPLDNAISTGSIDSVTKELDKLIEQASSESESENREGQAVMPRVKDMRILIKGYYTHNENIANRITAQNKVIAELEEIKDVSEKSGNIYSLRDNLQKINTKSSNKLKTHINSVLRKALKKAKNIDSSELDDYKLNVSEKIYSDILNETYLKLAKSKDQLASLSRKISTKESLLRDLYKKVEQKKDTYSKPLVQLNERINSLNMHILDAQKTVDEYSDISITPENVVKYLDIVKDPLFELGKEILLNGVGIDHKLMTARDYVQKASHNSKPFFSPLAAIYIDDHININFSPINSLTGELPKINDFRDSGRKLLGITSTAVLNRTGVPQSYSKMLTTPEGYVSDRSLLSPDIVDKLVFFENLHNNIMQNHINSGYGLVSVEFKGNQPIYRLEGIIASDFFTELDKASLRRMSNQ